LGRRQSIERTTARRCPSARKRPGAGYLPTLAPGRPRAPAGDRTMTLLRRAPREVYRVYSEEEFFDGVAHEQLFEPILSAERGERRLRRLAGAAMLAGAVGTVGGAIAVDSSRPARGPGRRIGADSHAATRAYVATRVFAAARPHASGRALAVQAPLPASRAHTSHGGRGRGGREDGARRWQAQDARQHGGIVSAAAPPGTVATRISTRRATAGARRVRF
jgi:hypothetical protein